MKSRERVSQEAQRHGWSERYSRANLQVLDRWEDGRHWLAQVLYTAGGRFWFALVWSRVTDWPGFRDERPPEALQRRRDLFDYLAAHGA